MKDLRGKKAVVTGGAMGIGFETSRRLLLEGCDVTIWDMNAKALEEAKEKLGSLGRVFTYTCDVANKEQVFELARQAEADMGQVDILVNNAGFVRTGRFLSFPVEDWERETNVNLVSMYYTIHAFLPGMYRRNLGYIINVSSSGGLVGVTDLSVYCASKWGVWGLTEGLRFEAVADKKTGVHFSSIHPHFLKHGMFEGGKTNFLGELFLPRIEKHDTVAEAIVEKAIKKNWHVVKVPINQQLILMARAFLPDSILMLLFRLLGIGGAMSHWVGRPGCEHAQKR